MGRVHRALAVSGEEEEADCGEEEDDYEEKEDDHGEENDEDR